MLYNDAIVIKYQDFFKIHVHVGVAFQYDKFFLL